MLKTEKTINLYGTITITVDGIEETVMTVSSNIPDNGNPSINQNVQNRELYLGNTEAVSNDLKEFSAVVKNLMEV